MSEPTRSLLTGIVATVREPLIVLDDQLRIVTASHSFYNTFQVSPVETEGAHIYDLGDGQWDIPALRHLLETIVPQNTTMEAYEVEHDFPGIGSRCMLLNARRIQSAEGHATTLLLAMQDVTDLRAAEREKDELLRQKDLLLKEMRHRVNNSLQIIASILLLKAHSVRSKETRRHLQDAHSRVMAVATVQEQLRPATYGESIKIGPYLRALCSSIAASMAGDNDRISIEVVDGEGSMISTDAVSLGLIVTELLINALKHAFPGDTTGRISVAYHRTTPTGWCLSVSDNGMGQSQANKPTHRGLGTSIVEALANQLDARVGTSSSPSGTTVTVINGSTSAKS